MLRFNTYAKPCLRWLLAAIIALAPTAAWADGSPPFVVTTLPAAVVHALPPLSSRAAPGPAMGDFVLPPEEARATNLRNCADVGHGNGSVAPSDSNGAVGKNNIVAVTGAGIGLYDKSSCLLGQEDGELGKLFWHFARWALVPRFSEGTL
jgi:hypothetical protein